MTKIELILQEYPEEDFLLAQGFDNAILGVDPHSMRIIYSVSRCIEILMEEGLDEDEALDHFSYNVMEGYVGEKTPIWCRDFS
jgi:hypothetical protein